MGSRNLRLFAQTQRHLIDGLKQGGQLFFHDSRLFHIFFWVVAFQFTLNI